MSRCVQLLLSALSFALAAACSQSGGDPDAKAEPGSAPDALDEAVTVFIATGNEPAWKLTVVGDGIELLLNYGEDKVSVGRPDPDPIDDGYSYRVKTEAHLLVIDVFNMPCSDSMTGMPHPNAVTVTVDGETLYGCGGMSEVLLTGNEWIVEDIDNKGIIDSSRATLLFVAGGGLSGRGSCNQYNSSYELTGEGLSIGNIAATRRACAPSLMDQESRFFAILGAAQRFTIAGDGALVISAGTGETITARR